MGHSGVREGCTLMLKEGPSMIFISQPGEHIHRGLGKSGGERGRLHPRHMIRLWSSSSLS